MKRSKYISFLLAAVMLVTTLVFPMQTEAAVDFSGLYDVQKYYLRVIGSLARADYYKNDVLASVTLSQAIFEGGWGAYSLPIGGNNLFGIKAYYTWGGMVYDQNTSRLYESYEDYLLTVGQIYVNDTSAWRAHSSWSESVDVHSRLFVEESQYAAVIGEKNYKTATQAIVAGGYCTDDGYAERVIQIIERYGLTVYDDLSPDADGIVAITASSERVNLNIGDTFDVSLDCYPSDKTPSSITWKSENPAVATVDENGKVTAVSHGMTLISATLANGREACCIVYVDCNATVMDSDVAVRVSPSATASSNGKIYRGAPIKVTSDEIYTDASGNKYIAVTGYNSKGVLVNGYVLDEFVYRNTRNVAEIAVVANNISLTVNQQYETVAAVVPCDAVDANISWSSSDESVATVDENGVITALKLGNAVITAKAAGGVQTSINVSVVEQQPKFEGVVSANPNIVVRETPSRSAKSLGNLAFLTKITVNGAPNGYWYNITGKTSSGRTVTGYILSSYVHYSESGKDVVFETVGANTAVYKEPDTASDVNGALVVGNSVAVIGDKTEGFNYVVSLGSDSEAVHGYAVLTSVGNTSSVTSPWYGVTNSNLYVRSGAGTNYDVVGTFAKDTKITISGEENGFYKVSGVSDTGATVSGYSSADYITTLYSGVTTTLINIRSGAGTSNPSLGQLASGTDVVVIGEIQNGWYHVEATTVGGNNVRGYCSADYVTVLGKLSAGGGTVTPQPSEGFEIIDDQYSITDGILNGVTDNTTVATLRKAFNGDVAVVSTSGVALSASDIVGTGARIRVTLNGTSSDVATVVVKGDVDGDGDITATDYLLVKRAFFGTYTLSGVYLKAALVGGKSELDVTDYILIKRAYFGTYTF